MALMLMQGAVLNTDYTDIEDGNDPVYDAGEQQGEETEIAYRSGIKKAKLMLAGGPGEDKGEAKKKEGEGEAEEEEKEEKAKKPAEDAGKKTGDAKGKKDGKKPKEDAGKEAKVEDAGEKKKGNKQEEKKPDDAKTAVSEGNLEEKSGGGTTPDVPAQVGNTAGVTTANGEAKIQAVKATKQSAATPNNQHLVMLALSIMADKTKAMMPAVALP